MAVIQELQLPGFSLPQSRDAKEMLAAAFWGWFDKHQDDEVFTTRIWFIRISIRLKQLEPVFERIFGPR